MAVRASNTSLTTAQVLGGTHETRIPLSYIDRAPIQDAFTRALSLQSHIVVFGTSGVGKSGLIRRNVDWSDVIFVECLSGQRAPDVYRSMLSEAGARIKTETKLTKKRRLSGTLKLFTLDGEKGTENTETEVTIDLGNVGDVFRILRSRGQRSNFVMLNNFHLLARGVQRRIVGDLQYVFERTGIRFIIVGNWTSSAYLTDLNPMLPSFVADVHVPPWSDDDLLLVLRKTEELLNVSFTDEITEELIKRSVGSVRELVDKCRALLVGADVQASQAPAVVIDDIDELREITARGMARLHSRYAVLLSDYLAVKLYTTQGVDVDKLIDRTASDLVKDEDDDEDDERTYTLDELRQAVDDAVQAFNEPRLAEQARRLKIIEKLAAAIRRPGNSEVSVSLPSIVGSGEPNTMAEEYALCDSAKRLVRAQSQYGFRPPLLAYDPHGRALIAIEPKFRLFLHADPDAVTRLQRVELRSVDRSARGWHKRDKWRDAISEAAATRRWMAQHVAAAVPESAAVSQPEAPPS